MGPNCNQSQHRKILHGGQSLKKIHPWLAQAGETWKAPAAGLKGRELKRIVLSLTVFPLFIHSHYMIDFFAVTGKGYWRVMSQQDRALLSL